MTNTRYYAKGPRINAISSAKSYSRTTQENDKAYYGVRTRYKNSLSEEEYN